MLKLQSTRKDTITTNCEASNHEGLNYLARTDKRGAQGAGVPVLGRFGMALSWRDLRLSVRGVMGESSTVPPRDCSLQELTLAFFVPEENIFLTRESREVYSFSGLGFYIIWMGSDRDEKNDESGKEWEDFCLVSSLVPSHLEITGNERGKSGIWRLCAPAAEEFKISILQGKKKV